MPYKRRRRGRSRIPRARRDPGDGGPGVQRKLKAAGFDHKDVVAADVFITDVARFNEMNEGYRPFFQTDPPVRATVGVDRFGSPAVLLEITLSAVK